MTKECFTSKSSPAPHTGKQFFWDVLCPGLHRTLGTGLGEWRLHGKKPRYIQGQWHRQPPCEQRRRRGRASVLVVTFSKSLSCTPMVQEAALPLAFWVPSSHSFWSLHFCQMLEQCNSVFSSVQSLSGVQLFATPWPTGRQASLSIINCRSPPKPMSIESLMPSNHLILCHPLLLLPSTFPSIRVFFSVRVLLKLNTKLRLY